MTPEAKDTWATQHLFMVMISGEAYERRLTDIGSLFVFEEEDTKLWTVLYHSGYPDKKGVYSGKSTIKAELVKWEKALSEAENYIRWFVKTTKGGKKRAW